MKNKFEIFDHLKQLLLLIGDLSSFKVSRAPNLSMITGYPSPMFNLVSLKAIDDNIITKLKKDKIPFICLPEESLEHEFEEIMLNQSLVKADFVMAQTFNDLSTWTYKDTIDINVSKVINDNDLSTFDKISSVAFQHEERLAYNFLKSAIGHPDIHLFIASQGGIHVASGIVAIINNNAGLYWGGVLPQYRNKGLGTALTKYRMNFIKERGFNSVCAQNMTSSVNYYQKIRFKPIGGLPLYLFPGN